MIQKKQMVREEMAGYKNSAIVLYQSPDGSISIDVRLEKETLWMDAHQMARLFGRDRSVIVRHIRNMYDTNELDQDSTYAKNAQVAADGKLRQMDLYNLDVIIGVGYRVNSRRGTRIIRHLSNVFREGELNRESAVAFFATTDTDGKTYKVEYFNLEAIINDIGLTAESNPRDKDVMIRLTMNMLTGER